ncbi:hypothetical protein B0F90DRAFT_1916098 [Multifurca ochricompacta]|uniref:Uncharacterized protein n=1 Tax=Multifurca ochricompacta TaxID=376703 RepID=A0AAD4QQY6_9AGAM|nr:hypothetical protein B0F90DRAFT_1916098 [Multifurca ochricompacta]
MANSQGIKGIIESVVKSLGSAESSLEDSANSGVNKLGNAIFGQNPGLETANAPAVEFDPDTVPVSHGRRSVRPDGVSPDLLFRSSFSMLLALPPIMVMNAFILVFLSFLSMILSSAISTQVPDMISHQDGSRQAKN